MRIRRFEEADAGEVSELIIKTLRISNTKDYPVQMMEELSLHMQPEDILKRAGQTHFYVVEENGVIVGCGAIGPYRDRTDESGLFNIFVLPEYQGRGIGRQIVETLEQDAYALRAERMELSASITGLPFYLKMGYDYKNGIAGLDEEQLYKMEKYRNIVYRRMAIDDYDRVYALWMSCKNMGLNHLDDSREGIDRYLRRNPATCFIALEGERIVGVILAGHDGRRGFIHHTAVAEDHRRLGVAGNLLKLAQEALKEEGIHKAALLVFNRNEAGNAFWESQGFTARHDITYRNKAFTELTRIDT